MCGQISLTGNYEISGGSHSSSMCAPRITLPHLSVSSAMSFPNSAGAIGIGSPPSSRKRAINIPQHGIDRSVELFDHLRRRALGSANAVPDEYLVAGDGHADRWHVGQRVDAFRRGHAERPDAAGPDLLDRAWQIVEKHRYLTAEQIRHCGRCAAIGHVRELD